VPARPRTATRTSSRKKLNGASNEELGPYPSRPSQQLVLMNSMESQGVERLPQSGSLSKMMEKGYLQDKGTTKNPTTELPKKGSKLATATELDDLRRRLVGGRGKGKRRHYCLCV